MQAIINDICGLSLLLAGVIGLVRFRSISPVYYPFLYFVWLGCANELLSTVLAHRGFYTTVNNNIYVLLASAIMLWFFKSIGLFDRRPRLFDLLLASFATVWLYETFVLRDIQQISSYFRMYFSFVVVLLSVSAINRILVSTTGAIHTSPVFLIATGFIVFYTYKVLIEAFWLYGLGTSHEFAAMVYQILIYIIFFVNLIYALAALWIPKQRPSILLSSSPV